VPSENSRQLAQPLWIASDALALRGGKSASDLIRPGPEHQAARARAILDRRESIE